MVRNSRLAVTAESLCAATVGAMLLAAACARSSRNSRIATLTNCQAESSSASRSHGRWSDRRACS
jgi:hypothetical protein